MTPQNVGNSQVAKTSRERDRERKSHQREHRQHLKLIAIYSKPIILSKTKNKTLWLDIHLVHSKFYLTLSWAYTSFRPLMSPYCIVRQQTSL